MASDQTFDPEAWERQNGEKKGEFRAFELYFALGEGRSYQDMWNQLKMSGGTIEYQDLRQMADQWDWEARIVAKTVHEYVRSQAQHDKELDDMDKRHLELITSIQDRVRDTFKGANFARLSPAELGGWLKLAQELEREVRG